MQTESESPRRAIKLDGPSSLIAAVPHLVGFTPDNSLVLVVMSGPRSRVVLTVRADLPETYQRGELVELLDSISRALTSAGGEQVVGICYPPDDGLDTRAVLKALEVAMRGINVEVVDFLVVLAENWWSELGAESTAPQALPSALRSPTPAQAALILEGRAPLASRQDLVTSFASLAVNDRRRLTRVQVGQATQLDVAEAANLLSGSDDLDQTSSAALLAALQTAKWRDGLIAQILKGATAPNQGLANHLRGVCERLRPLVQAAPAGVVAPVATTLAVLAWQAGEGAIAACAIGRALLDDPEYRLAVLVQAALLTAMPPWLGRESLLGAPESPEPPSSGIFHDRSRDPARSSG